MSSDHTRAWTSTVGRADAELDPRLSDELDVVNTCGRNFRVPGTPDEAPQLST